MPKSAAIHTEEVFEDELCAQLATGEWTVKTHLVGTKSYDRGLAIYPDDLLDFVKETGC